ncbi:hypothetical protein VIGAN_03188800 [Vigna angularis var. angularis]|uniref:Integrase zinc-binding domain-containing protein n=1 Tax=Vigna angularis var. angularis TaxID=157739 RepID=A0A0S3RMZ9_PHAAN|nr:hypothetical protein VIGAN_03188800 [Vigna angularis var. angularis]
MKTFANIPLRSHIVDDIKEVVQRDNKQRFSLMEENGELLICANQGHTVMIGGLVVLKNTGLEGWFWGDETWSEGDFKSLSWCNDQIGLKTGSSFFGLMQLLFDRTTTGYSLSLLRCVTLDHADYIIRETHEGIYGYHLGPRTMISRILKVSYFWPKIEADYVVYVRRCKPCQKH